MSQSPTSWPKSINLSAYSLVGPSERNNFESSAAIAVAQRNITPKMKRYRFCRIRRILRSGRRCCLRFLAHFAPEPSSPGSRRRNVGEAHVLYGVRVPVTIIEVPPFIVVHRKSLCFHCAPQQGAVLSLLGGAACVIGMRSLRHLVISARHRNRTAGRAIEQRQIDGTTAVMPRPVCRISDVLVLVGRGGVPENLRDVPGAKIGRAHV